MAIRPDTEGVAFVPISGTRTLPGSAPSRLRRRAPNSSEAQPKTAPRRNQSRKATNQQKSTYAYPLLPSATSASKTDPSTGCANDPGIAGCGKSDTTGKSLLIFRNHVKSRTQKYSASHFGKSEVEAVPSHPRGGASAVVTERWDEMRWTPLFGRRPGKSVRRSRVVLASVADAKPVEMMSSQPVRLRRQSARRR